MPSPRLVTITVPVSLSIPCSMKKAVSVLTRSNSLLSLLRHGTDGFATTIGIFKPFACTVFAANFAGLEVNSSRVANISAPIFSSLHHESELKSTISRSETSLTAPRRKPATSGFVTTRRAFLMCAFSINFAEISWITLSSSFGESNIGPRFNTTRRTLSESFILARLSVEIWIASFKPFGSFCEGSIEANDLVPEEPLDELSECLL
mmetsp:Transcript_29052/g.40497  ORF Transcript_29052/g.40497 Transcript_29052/m.40497 type:complete len:207 (-) Transcript_29052:207-827(-)